MDSFASLNHDIYIAAEPTPVDVDHAAHAGAFTQRIMTTTRGLH